MEKKRILDLFPPLKEHTEYVKENGPELFAPQHYWFYDSLIAAGHEVDFMDSDENTWLNKLGTRLRFRFLQQEMDALKVIRKYDLIYAPYISYVFFLSILKVLGLIRKPIVVFSHAPLTRPPSNNWLKKIYRNVLRYIQVKGPDRIFLLSKPILDKSNEHPIKGNFVQVQHFGVHFEFFDAYAKAQSQPPSADYFFTTGGNHRDFDTLVEAMRGIDYRLKVVTIDENLQKHVSVEIPSNVEVDTSLPFNRGSTGYMRKDYYNAFAVLVPLTRDYEGQLETFGATVVAEGMAMGKPIICTRNPSFPFDLEKEGVGIYVDYGDVEGWRRAIQYLVDHPDKAREMGERARELVRDKFNYTLFSREVVNTIHDAMGLDPLDFELKLPYTYTRKFEYTNS